MRIVHCYHDGKVRCGLLDRHGRVLSLKLPPDESTRDSNSPLRQLLQMSPERRDEIEARVLEAGEVLLEHPARLAPAVPDPPLYIYLHGNAPTLWKRQTGALWDMPRVPHVRVRPWSSLAGHGAEISVPVGAKYSSGTEFAVVIGRPARDVSPELAHQHIAGIICTNDGYLSGLHDDFVSSIENCTVHRQALDTLYKSADGMGGLGPCIVTIEEVERDCVRRVGHERLDAMKAATGRMACLYDLMTRNYHDSRCVDRSHTSAYLMDAEYVIAYLSRFMTLQTGSIIGLGSAGWDGQWGNLAAEPGASQEQECEVEEYGRLRMYVSRSKAQESLSPLLAQREKCGLSRLPGEERTTRSFWMARGNHRGADEIDNVPADAGLCPFSLPWGTLGDNETPIVIPSHATTLHCSVQLAGVIGDEAAYNVRSEDALKYLKGVAVLVALHDASLGEDLQNPTDYESRSAYLLGQFGDGFCRIGELVPVGEIDAWPNLNMEIELLRPQSHAVQGESTLAKSSAADYRYDLSHMVAMVSRTSTLLPGDVLSLGHTGKNLVFSPENNDDAGAGLRGKIEGIGKITIRLNYKRATKPHLM